MTQDEGEEIHKLLLGEVDGPAGRIASGWLDDMLERHPDFSQAELARLFLDSAREALYCLTEHGCRACQGRGVRVLVGRDGFDRTGDCPDCRGCGVVP
jgi:hypothetical protein